jgi:hypothetical protein
MAPEAIILPPDAGDLTAGSRHRKDGAQIKGGTGFWWNLQKPLTATFS